MTDAMNDMVEDHDGRISDLDTRVSELEAKILEFVTREEIPGVVATAQASGRA